MSLEDQHSDQMVAEETTSAEHVEIHHLDEQDFEGEKNLEIKAFEDTRTRATQVLTERQGDHSERQESGTVSGKYRPFSDIDDLGQYPTLDVTVTTTQQPSETNNKDQLARVVGLMGKYAKNHLARFHSDKLISSTELSELSEVELDNIEFLLKINQEHPSIAQELRDYGLGSVSYIISGVTPEKLQTIKNILRLMEGIDASSVESVADSLKILNKGGYLPHKSVSQLSEADVDLVISLYRENVGNTQDGADNPYNALMLLRAVNTLLNGVSRG